MEGRLFKKHYIWNCPGWKEFYGNPFFFWTTLDGFFCELIYIGRKVVIVHVCGKWSGRNGRWGCNTLVLNCLWKEGKWGCEYWFWIPYGRMEGWNINTLIFNSLWKEGRLGYKTFDFWIPYGRKEGWDIKPLIFEFPMEGRKVGIYKTLFFWIPYGRKEGGDI